MSLYDKILQDFTRALGRAPVPFELASLHEKTARHVAVITRPLLDNFCRAWREIHGELFPAKVVAAFHVPLGFPDYTPGPLFRFRVIVDTGHANCLVMIPNPGEDFFSEKQFAEYIGRLERIAASEEDKQGWLEAMRLDTEIAARETVSGMTAWADIKAHASTVAVEAIKAEP